MADTKATIQIIAEAVDKFTAPAMRINHQIEALGKSFHRVGQVVAGFVLFEVGKKMFEWTEAIAHNAIELGAHARRLDVSVEALSRWRFAAEEAGVSTQGFEAGLLKIQKALEAAREGSFEAVEVFKVLGIEITTATRPLDILPEIAEGLAKLQNPADRATASIRLLGAKTNELMALLNLGRDRIDEIRHEADLFGATIDEKTVASLKRFENSMHHLNTLVQFFARNIITVFAEEITPTIEKFGHFIGEHKDVVVAFFVALERQAFQWAKVTLGVFGDVAKGIVEFFRGTEQTVDAQLLQATQNVAALQRMVAKGDRDAFTLSELKRHQELLDSLGEQKRSFLETRDSAAALNKAIADLEGAWERSGHGAAQAGAETKKTAESMRTAGKELQKALESQPTQPSVFRQEGFEDRLRRDAELFDKAIVQRLEGRARELAVVEANYDRELRSLEELNAKKLISDEAYAEALIGLEMETARRRRDLRTDFGSGVEAGLRDLNERYKDHAKVAREAVNSVADAFESRMAEALFAAMDDWRTFGSAFKSVAKAFIQDIMRMISRVIAFRVASALFGGIGLGGGGGGGDVGENLSGNAHPGLFGRKEGGLAGGNRVWQFSAGGLVPGTRTSRDSVFAFLQPREYVQTEAATDFYGVAAMDRIRRRQIPREALAGDVQAVFAAPGGGQVVNQYTVNIQAADAQDVYRVISKSPEHFFGLMRRGLSEDRSTIQAARGAVR